MPQPKPNPTGTTLIRLADIPKDQRIKAALELMAGQGDTSEWPRLYELAFYPKDESGRIST